MTELDDDGSVVPAKFDYTDRVYGKMEPGIKAKWVEALRSGEYTQGKGTLNRLKPLGKDREAGLCCLGVLCEVGVKDGVIERRDEIDPEHASYRFIVEKSDLNNIWVDTMPSSEITNWAGLDVSAESDLAELNDDGGRSFVEIAAFVEERL